MVLAMLVRFLPDIVYPNILLGLEIFMGPWRVQPLNKNMGLDL